MATTRRRSRKTLNFSASRPTGELVWMHAPATERLTALLHLAARLKAQRPDLNFLLTTDEEVAPAGLDMDMMWSPCPPDTGPTNAQFLEHWKPDFCLWSYGRLRPGLIAAADEAGIPLAMVDASEDGFEEALWRLFPDLSRSTLERFGSVFAMSGNAAKRLRRLGLRDSDIRVMGPLQDSATVPGCNDTEREEIHNTIIGRPVWLAANARAAEIPQIIATHTNVTRLAHRLLLILSPAEPEDCVRATSYLENSGLRFGSWTNGDWPEETTQVLISEDPNDLGLWYRLAPVSFVGGSLVPGYGGQSPYPAATLGSAILYGPHIRKHLAAYSRLAETGAARIVKDDASLGAALQQLIAPDQAAAMAHAAWEVVTSGAEVTDHMLDLVQDTLDLKEMP